MSQGNRDPRTEEPLLDLRLLGLFQVRVSGAHLPRARSRKAQWLLALLALRAGCKVEREWLAETLWPDCPSSQALALMRRELTDLRRVLGPAAGLLRSPTPRTLCLDLTGAFVDVVAFDQALGRGDALSLEEAVSLYHGPLLQGWQEEWVFEERMRREQAYLNVLETLAGRALAAGDGPGAEKYLRRVVTLEPFRESAQRLLMQLLAEGGNYAAALQTHRDLRRLLHRELNAAPDPQTTALFQQIKAEARHRAGSAPGARPRRSSLSSFSLAPAVAPSGQLAREQPDDPVVRSPRKHTAPHLPLQLTRFIGREKEVAAVKQLLIDRRLVTLTGAGGCGKTRLALQVAGELLGDSEAPELDGVRLVELAPLADPGLVPQALASALAAREIPGRSLTETLVDALRSRSLLIVLDNCEHLLGGCAELAEELLRVCPKLRILATSREGLNIPGETAYRLPSLLVPEEERTPLETLGQIEAVQLFVDRAQAATPSFTLTESNAPAVAAICRRLDGIPLAIELAAARVKALPLETINARLDDRFRLLTRGSRTGLRRHQTLRALIDWSYDLLSEPERVLLRRLSVFSGGWTLEAAEAVCDEAIGRRPPSVSEGGSVFTDGPRPTANGPLDVLDLISRLVEKSLVLYDDQGSEARYRFLETVRQYSFDRLLEVGEAESVRRRHRDWCLAFAERADPELRGPGQGVWLQRLEREHDNVRAALEWCQSDEESAETGLRLAGALAWFWGMHDCRSEGRAWLEGALAGTTGLGRTAARAKALHHAGSLAWTQGDWVAARSRLEESVAIWHGLGNQEGAAHSLRELAIVMQWLGEPAAARSLAGESVALLRHGEDEWGLALSLFNLGNRISSAGDYEAGRSLLEESLKLFRQTGDRWGISCSLRGLGLVAFRQGDYAAARSLLEECLQRPRYVATRWGTAGVLIDLGRVARCEGDYGRAAALFKESLILNRDLTSKDLIAQVLHNLGYVAQHQGDDERAARLLGAADALIDATSRWLDPAQRAEYEHHATPVRAALGEAGFAAAWAEGRAMTLGDAVRVALAENEIRPPVGMDQKKTLG